MKRKLVLVILIAILMSMVLSINAAAYVGTMYDVTFNYNDGVTTPHIESIYEGTTVSEPTDPTRAGYIFDGWHTDVDCKIPYDFSEPVHADFDLYAHWVAEGTFRGSIKGSIEDTLGDPVAGYTVTLWSRPVSDTTSASGDFSLGDVHYIDHTLRVFDGVTPIKIYSISFVQGSAPSSVVDEGLSTIVVTYTTNTLGISIPLQLDGAGSAIVNGGQVIFDQAPVTNPQTGDGSNVYFQITLGMLLLILAGVILKKRAVAK